ncbi:hypothetical protein LUZ60_016857 [Juncus effusus]|nr:hypothetical protein LUZ60_016857 [Juncus effusus]
MGILNLVQFWRIFGIKMANDSKFSSRKEATTNIYLNIYDLSPVNTYLCWFGLGVFHSGIEVHGMEYGYGAHEYPTSGVFEVSPRICPGFHFKQSLKLGSTDMSVSDFQTFIQDMASRYHGDCYNLISKNCNHFTDEVSVCLTGKGIPGWVNRLARLGSYFNCLLPDGIQVSQVKHVPAQKHSNSSDTSSESVMSSITDGIDDEEVTSDQHLILSPNRYSVSSNSNSITNSTDSISRDKTPTLAKDLM